MSDDPMAEIRACANAVAEHYDADVLLYNGGIWRQHSDQVIEACCKRTRRTNIFLILTTPGGDPHAAYRIARTLQQHYKKFIAFIPGFCKSAGTLLVLGAHELVMSPHAELGPIDLQVPRADEVGERSSVLTPTDALRVLQSQAIRSFIDSFVDFRTEALLPTKLAAEMSATLVAGLYHDVFGQVDPMRLGELERATNIAIQYGERLIAHGRNAKDEALIKLVGGYPSHLFVIDKEEAKDLFLKIREPSPDESILAIRDPVSDDKAFVGFLNSTVDSQTPGGEAEHEQTEGERTGKATPGDGVDQGTSDRSPDEGEGAKQNRDRTDGGDGSRQEAAN